jgi:non-heme chloroperoxidase
MSTVIAKDGTQIYYKDWGTGTGEPVVFCHGWPLCADAWESQMVFLAKHGYRCIAHDRRGFGRSSQPWTGNDMNTYSDDLSDIFENLNLKNVTLIGHSAGGGEVARYIGRHGTSRIARVVLLSAVTPFRLKTESNPEGSPIEAFDEIRTGILADRPQFFKDLAFKFFGANRENHKVSKGTLEAYWLRCMQGGLWNVLECVKAFSETDFTEDLKLFDIPTLIIHGDDDQIVPIGPTAKMTAKIIKGAVLKIYPGGSHGLADTHSEELNADLLAFIGSRTV